MSDLRTLAEVAAHFRKSEKTMRRLLPTVPGLRPIRIGRAWLFAAPDIELIERSLVVPTQTKPPRVGHPSPGGFVFEPPADGRLNPFWLRFLGRCRRNARSRGLDFTIDEHELVKLVGRAGGRCEVSGLPFSNLPRLENGQRPFAPSLDRIDSSQPYHPGNVRLVCFAVNIAMNAWGDDVLWTIVGAMARRRTRRKDRA